MKSENALIKRRMFEVGDGRVVVEEIWDTKHPDCPFVASPYSSAMLPNPGLRQIVMRQEEYDQLQPPLKS